MLNEKREDEASGSESLSQSTRVQKVRNIGYIQEKSIPNLFEALLEDMLEEQPDDPAAFTEGWARMRKKHTSLEVPSENTPPSAQDSEAVW